MTPQENLERVKQLLERKRTPKAKGQGLARSKRVNPINRERKAKLSAQNFGPCSRMARLSPCVVKTCKRLPPHEPAHVRSRGAGGQDFANVVSMCTPHHREQHDSGIQSFQARYGLDLEAEANAIAVAVANHECDDWPELTRQGLRCAVCLKPIKEPRP